MVQDFSSSFLPLSSLLKHIGFHLDTAFCLSPYKNPALVHNAYRVNPTWNPGHLFCTTPVPRPSWGEKLQDKHEVQWEGNHTKLQFLQSFVFPLQNLNVFSVCECFLQNKAVFAESGLSIVREMVVLLLSPPIPILALRYLLPQHSLLGRPHLLHPFPKVSQSNVYSGEKHNCH